MSLQTHLLQPGAGTAYWVLGDLYAFKLTGQQTEGRLTVMEQVISPGGGPPPHVHHREDEWFYVLEGSFTFQYGEQEQACGPGAQVFVPKGTLHTFRNNGPGNGRLLVTVAPAGLEDFFYAIGTPAQDTDSPPPFDPAVLDRVMQLAGNYHMSIVLPH